MKKEKLLLVKFFVLLYPILNAFAIIDGSLNFLMKFGLDSNKINSFMEVLKVIFNLISPVLIGWLILFVLRLKEKIKALKEYKDMEVVSILNKLNANIEILENKVTYLNDKIGAYNDVDVIDPISHIGRKESESQFEKKLKEYNDCFKDWGCDELGKGHLSIIPL